MREHGKYIPEVTVSEVGIVRLSRAMEASIELTQAARAVDVASAACCSA